MTKEYRKLFPVTLQKIYLNHAAISPLSTRVTNRMDEFIDERSFGVIDNFPNGEKYRNQARETIAAMIHAQPQQIAFIGNTSEGFNHLVNGLNWHAGDEVLLVEGEFPSNVYPFLNLEKRFGVKPVFVPQRNGQIYLEDIAGRMSERTRLLSISFVEFSNGFRNDLQAIGALCKERDILFSVDGIQGVGAIELDVQACNIDFISNGGHKWLMGTMGAGFMYMAPELFECLQPAFTGWLAVENAWDFSGYRLALLPDSRRFEYGTANFLGISALSASVELLHEIGVPAIERHLLGLGEQLIEGLQEQGLTFMGAVDSKHWSGIYSFSGKQTGKLFEYLQNQGIICSLRNDMLRVAPHFYNTKEEIDELITAVRKFY